jgi:hypothetical protein
MGQWGLRGMREDIVGGLLSDVHFVIVKRVHRKVISGVRLMGINGLVEMRV